MSFPLSWIDRLFDKLTLTYGQQFLRRWQDIEINDVKSDWGHELAGFAQHPRAIAWALQNLPTGQPPNVLEFRAIARRAPPEDVPRIELQAANPERVAQEMEKLAPLRRPVSYVDHLHWANAIVARDEYNQDNKIKRQSPLVLQLAREALGLYTSTKGAN